MDLTQIAVLDKKWRAIAFNLTNELSLADDLVQELYLVLHTIEAPISENAIRVILNKLYFDSKKEMEWAHPDSLFFLEDTLQPTEQDFTELEITLLTA